MPEILLSCKTRNKTVELPVFLGLVPEFFVLHVSYVVGLSGGEPRSLGSHESWCHVLFPFLLVCVVLLLWCAVV